MMVLKVILGECVGLFVDDRSLALGIFFWVGLIALLTTITALPTWADALLLVFGLLVLLLENLCRSARRLNSK